MQTFSRCHHMPFGSELVEAGRVRFRLWAPSATHVSVCLTNNNTWDILPMNPEADGWFNLVTDKAAPGRHYKFRIDDEIDVPDPASRFQPEDVHGVSEVIDPQYYQWKYPEWPGRPWEEAVIYECHVGTFTPSGNFIGVIEKLDYLVALGISALELMPVADFPGKRNWGYDGVYHFAPDSQYGRPEDLKALIDAAHARGLMVFLDVVYNHFGPEGNYLHRYAPQFFTEHHSTPWGAAINYDDRNCYWVRQFFIHNALFWLEEYHLDGLRLDAVHAIIDDSEPDILTELADTVEQKFGNLRHIHLVLENDHNAAHYLSRSTTQQPKKYVAQWNDDIHHALHVILTGETRGYYQDYEDNPIHYLGRCLVEGFAYQGESSAYRDHQARGEPSRHLPPTAFVSFLQNHDQVGNRAFGERISYLTDAKQLHAALSILLLAPSPPLLFMGQEWNCRQPFLFFCDFGDDLVQNVVDGRRREFSLFPEFKDPASRECIPDPTVIDTFSKTVLDWNAIYNDEAQIWLQRHRDLLSLRHKEIVPRLHQINNKEKTFTITNNYTIHALWELGDNSRLKLLANLGNEATELAAPIDNIIYSTDKIPIEKQISPWSAIWSLQSTDIKP